MAVYHPHIVHFAIALVFVGVGFRLLTFYRRLAFLDTAATALILLGTAASFLAVQSGDAAHGPVERMPGARPAVVEHEEWGNRARNIFAIVSVLELAVVALRRRQHRLTFAVSVVAAVVGVVGLGAMYEAAEHGGELVYSYAGGVGTRTGDPEDVNRLFLAGIYQQALQDREEGRGDAAMALLELGANRLTSNLELQLMTVEWLTDVKRDPAAALQRLDGLQVPTDNTRARVRAGLARAAALAAQGNKDGARGILQTLKGEFPNHPQVQRRLDEISR
jgi:uncharacterized membrane protein